MRRLTLAAALLALSGTAAAAGGAVNTKLDWRGSGRTCIDGKCSAKGSVRVTSNEAACFRGRKVHFTVVYEDNSKAELDTDRATKDGLAGGYGRVKEKPLEGILAVAPAVKAGGVRCREARFKYKFPSFP